MASPDIGASEIFQLPIKVQVEDGDRKWIHEYNGTRMLSIGRAEECDIVLTTSKASRRHAEVFGEGGRFTLLDSGSANGTKVNGARVDRRALASGDEIEIGTARIVFGDAPPRPPAPPAPVARTSDAAEPVSAAALPPAVPAVPFIERKRRKHHASLLNTVIPVLTVCALAILVLTHFALRDGAGGAVAPSAGVSESGTPTEIVSAAAVTSGAAATGTESPGSEQSEYGLVSRETEAKLDMMSLVEQARGGRAGWELIPLFHDLYQRYPGTPSAEEARRLIQVVEGIRGCVERGQKEHAEGWLRTLAQEERFAEALATCRYLADASHTEGERSFWGGRAAELDAEIRSRLFALEQSLAQLIGAGRAADALRALIDVREKYGGTALFSELLPRYVAAGLDQGSVLASGAGAISPEAAALEERAARAFEECRFRDLTNIYHSLLALDLSLDDRVKALEGLVEAYYYEQMLQRVIDEIATKPVEVSLSSTYRGKVVRVTNTEVESELDISGHPYNVTEPWSKVSTTKKFAVFEACAVGREPLLGVSLYAFRIGYDEGAQKALIRLRKRADAGELVNALLARQMGIAIPEGGFIEYRGRLVTPEAKAAAELALEEKRKAEEEARAEMRRLKRAATLASYLEWAKRMRLEGYFELAHRVLLEIAERGKGSTEGTEAERLAKDPVLAMATMVETGPASNRLDFAILAEGYPIEDDYQEAFTVSANTCMKLLLNHEPYREYKSYMNFKYIQLGSKDRGVDLIERKVERDTALDGRIEWQVFTVDNAKVMQILDRVEGSTSDHQALVIGNDYADVATGGGGVSCLSKSGLAVVTHEVGHSLAGLHDEYEQDPSTNPNRPMAKKREPNVPTSAMPPNVMKGSDREDVLAKAFWQYWIQAGEEKWWNGQKVSVFEGANRTPFNHWRPQPSCTMRDTGSRFCVVCMEHMMKTIYRYVRPIDRVEPDPAEPVSVASNDTVMIKVWPMKPETHFLEARWYLLGLGADPGEEVVTTEPEGEDDEPTGPTGVARKRPKDVKTDPTVKGEIYKKVFRTVDEQGKVVEVAVLDFRKMEPGLYQLTVEVVDPTPWVLKDDEGLLRDRRQWILRVTAPPKK